MDAFESLSHFFNAINEVYYRIDNQYKIGVKLDCLSAETEMLLNGSLDFKSSDLNATKSFQILNLSIRDYHPILHHVIPVPMKKASTTLEPF